MITFDTKISALTKVGKTTSRRLKKLDINNVWDLIWHLPRRYEDYSIIKNISDLKTNDHTTIKGRIELISSRRSRKKRMNLTECLLSDKSGSIKIIWFNQPYITKQLKNGDEIYISGKVDNDYYNLQFSNPMWEKTNANTIHTARIVPIYPSTNNITQKQIRFLIKQITPLFTTISEWLPIEILKQYDLIPLPEALKKIHWPNNTDDFAAAEKRLKFDELFIIQLIQEKNKSAISSQSAHPIIFQETKTKKLVKSLPFTLTDDQKKCAWEILIDIAKPNPMNRLLQGDVGSGKTVVAAIACLNTSFSGLQSVILAPTEILANQHWHTLQNTLKQFELNIGLLTRSSRQINTDATKITKPKIINKIAAGKLDIIIGTHALLQEKISFKNLGLIVIDEQHRFGVEQRAKLKDKTPKMLPHFLSMTATPIPRSLALTLYGDLNISIIKQKPPGRKKIITKVVSAIDREKAYDFIKNIIKQKQQVYVICPLIEESDKLGVKAATDEYAKLTKTIFPKNKIGLLHGKLKVAVKKEVMNKFKQGKIDILVSTSVIEVGVDIPNATVMIIEGADRFGLAQLHQFRGRIGRSDKQSYCFLFTDNKSQKTVDRLNALVNSDNGLDLAEYDMTQRGMGEIYGTRQSGLPDLKIASLTDLDLIKIAKQAARDIIKNSPDLSLYPLIKKEFELKYHKYHLE